MSAEFAKTDTPRTVNIRSCADNNDLVGHILAPLIVVLDRIEHVFADCVLIASELAGPAFIMVTIVVIAAAPVRILILVVVLVAMRIVGLIGPIAAGAAGCVFDIVIPVAAARS
jgi:hypothetical protein